MNFLQTSFEFLASFLQDLLAMLLRVLFSILRWKYFFLFNFLELWSHYHNSANMWRHRLLWDNPKWENPKWYVGKYNILTIKIPKSWSYADFKNNWLHDLAGSLIRILQFGFMELVHQLLYPALLRMDELLLPLKILFTEQPEQPTLIRRSIVLSITLQLVFPGLNVANLFSLV